MYIKKIYEYKIHNIDIWSINQLCTQRFPWPLFNKPRPLDPSKAVMDLIPFDDVEQEHPGLHQLQQRSGHPDSSPCHDGCEQLEGWTSHMSKKTVERKGMTTFFDWCKQNAHHPIHNLKLLFGNCNCHERSTVFLNPRESRPFFYLQEIGGYLYIYTYI